MTWHAILLPVESNWCQKAIYQCNKPKMCFFCQFFFSKIWALLSNLNTYFKADPVLINVMTIRSSVNFVYLSFKCNFFCIYRNYRILSIHSTDTFSDNFLSVTHYNFIAKYFSLDEREGVCKIFYLIRANSLVPLFHWVKSKTLMHILQWNDF